MEKKEAIFEKKILKMSLRDHSHIKPKNFIEFDEKQEQEYIQSKSRRWWYRINKKYFKKHTEIEYRCLLNEILSEYQLPLQMFPIKQQSFFYRNIFPKQSKIFQRKNIQVLFQNTPNQPNESDYFMMSYFFNILSDEEIQQKSQQQQFVECLPENINIRPLKQIGQENNIDQEFYSCVPYLGAIFNKGSADMELINLCLEYDLAQYKYYSSEIDRQIGLWADLLKKQAQENQQKIKMVFQNIQQVKKQEKNNKMLRNIQNGYEIQKDIKEIQTYLEWQNILLNFKKGFDDKTEEMLAEALENMWIKQNNAKNMGEQKKFLKASLENLVQTKLQLTNKFQTDCKVCFSTQVSQHNKVIYCDGCDQSFHQKCYGLDSVDSDVSTKFFCDACSCKGNGKKNQQILCQICQVKFSPLKFIDGHFFHPSCLFLLNMVEPKIGKLQFTSEYQNNQQILDFVKRQNNKINQLKDNFCPYCIKSCNKGLRVKCSQADCKKKFHFLCAYLNGAVFIMSRNNKKLQIQVKCCDHFPQRDHVRQIYLRRFFCNYKNTSDISENEFIELYKEEKIQIQAMQNEMKTVKSKKKKNYKKKNSNNMVNTYQNCISLDQDCEEQNTGSNNTLSNHNDQKFELEKQRFSNLTTQKDQSYLLQDRQLKCKQIQLLNRNNTIFSTTSAQQAQQEENLHANFISEQYPNSNPIPDYIGIDEQISEEEKAY